MFIIPLIRSRKIYLCIYYKSKNRQQNKN